MNVPELGVCPACLLLPCRCVQRVGAVVREAVRNARTCCEIVNDTPCGRSATRQNAESGVMFCEEHGGQNPLLRQKR